MVIKKVKLNEICDLQNGYAFKSSDYVENSNTLLCRMSNIRPEGYFDINYSSKYLPDSYSDVYKAYILSDNDLVIAMTDLANDPKILGVPTIVKTNGKKLLLNQRVGKLILKNEEIVDKEYLMYSLSAQKARNYFKKFAGGGLQINIGKKELLGVEIPLPEINIQRKIANILNEAKYLIQKRKKQLDLLSSLSQSLFLEMFGDPKINPLKFNFDLLENLALKITDGEHSTPKRVSVGIKLLSARNIKNSFIDYSAGLDFIDQEEYERISKRCKPEYNDVLLSCSGTIGRVSRYNSMEPIGLVRSVALIKPNKNIINSTYLENYLQTQFVQQIMKKEANQSSQANLFNNQIKKIPVMLPSMELQEAYSNIVLEIIAQKLLIEKSLTKLEYNFQSLMNRAFSGELINHQLDYA